MAISQPGARLIPEVRFTSAAAVLRQWAMVDGQNITPTGTPTVTILKPGGSPSSVTAAPVTMSGTQMTYTLNASDTAAWPLGRGYITQWEFSSNGETYVLEAQFDLVRKVFLPFIPITIDDLKNEDPQIDAQITNAAMSTDVHQRFIIPAWEHVYTWLRSHNRRPFCISDARILAPVTKYKALELYCRGVHQKPEDRWDKMTAVFEAKYRVAQAETVLEYDESEARQYQPVLAFVQPDVSSGPTNSFVGGDDWRRRIGRRPA